MTGIAELTWPVRTERLSIRPATADDLPATWEIRRLPSVVRWMTSNHLTLEAYVDSLGRPENLAKMLVMEHEGRLAGDLMLAVEDAWSQSDVREQAAGVQAELGWCLDPGLGGQGLATEAVRELIRISFEDLGLRRVIANCFADNESSWRLMERVGMRREAYTVKDSLHRSGGWLDGMTYALLAEEWST